jgi:hypothetical protein
LREVTPSRASGEMARARPNVGAGRKNTTARTAFGRAGWAKKIPAIPTLALVALPSALEA